MSYCGEHSLVKTLDGAKHAVSLRCRAWTCPDCAPNRKKQLIAQARGGNPNTFLTLTCQSSENRDPDQAALDLSHAWRLLRLRAIREAKRDIHKNPVPHGPTPEKGWPRNNRQQVERQVRLIGDKLPFLAVLEKTKLGWPHLHILLRSEWIAQAWLAAQMMELLSSPIVWITRIDSRSKRAAYVAKYCSKAANKFATAKRYWQSRDYDTRPEPPSKQPPQPGQGWERFEYTLQRLARDYTLLGYLVEWTASHRFTARPAPDDYTERMDAT